MKKHRRGLRLAACLLTLAMCAALLCSCGRTGKTDDYTAAMPVIVVGSDNYPPFNYMGTDGAPTGIDVELANPHRYRVRSLPATGALIHAEDEGEQMSLL